MAVDYKNAMVKISGPDLMALRNAFKDLPRNIAARVIGAGLKRASAPMVAALKETTPKGPTGNLRRAIKTVVKRYPRDGAAVAVVGYQKAGTGSSKSAAGGTVKKGPDRAFHQFWLEFGTKERYIGKPAATPYARGPRNSAVKQQGGYIASSFNRLGPFKLKAGKNGRVNTTPKYPKAFFIKSAQPIRISAMGATRPVQTAFNRSRNQVESRLYAEMQKALENGIKIVEYNAQKKADMAKLAGYL
jgi:hypothetical protein